jgi:hypothetical protein
MPLRIPYNQLPNLGVLQSGDIIPGLRPAFNEGSMTVDDLSNFVNIGKAYRVDMSQSGTSDPTVDFEYENWIGSIVWTYVSPGIYNGNLNAAFAGYVPTQTRTYFNASIGSSSNYYTITKIDDNNIKMEVKDKSWTLVDTWLFNTYIDFLIYPAAL